MCHWKYCILMRAVSVFFLVSLQQKEKNRMQTNRYVCSHSFPLGQWHTAAHRAMTRTGLLMLKLLCLTKPHTPDFQYGRVSVKDGLGLMSAVSNEQAQRERGRSRAGVSSMAHPNSHSSHTRSVTCPMCHSLGRVESLFEKKKKTLIKW